MSPLFGLIVIVWLTPAGLLRLISLEAEDAKVVWHGSPDMVLKLKLDLQDNQTCPALLPSLLPWISGETLPHAF
jgi:hypothetical protein